jgi:hypothetical protein
MANQVYNSFKRDSMVGAFNLSADTLKVVLVTSAYVPDIDTHSKYSDITDEVVGVGYTTSGSTLAGVVVSADLTGDKAVLDANDVTWASSTITAAAAVIFKQNSTPALSPLIGYIDFGGSKSSSNGDFVIQWNTSGILTLS